MIRDIPRLRWWEGVRVTCTAARAGIILTAGGYAGQRLTVVNEGAFSLTMAAAGTSHVAEGCRTSS